ncbi:MAG: hypothetical protein V7K60_31650 [Nostoc sp.]
MMRLLLLTTASPQTKTHPLLLDTTLDSGLFRLGTSAIAGSDRFIYDQTTGNLFFDADEIGKAAQVQIAQFSNQAVLSSANITVIV